MARYDIAPDAQNYLRNWYEPTGKVSVPVLTLHNRYDPVVPQFHETLFASAAAQASNSNLLVQRTALAPYGHCDFTIDEMVQALQDLVKWAENGVEPTAS